MAQLCVCQSEWVNVRTVCIFVCKHEVARLCVCQREWVNARPMCANACKHDAAQV